MCGAGEKRRYNFFAFFVFCFLFLRRAVRFLFFLFSFFFLLACLLACSRHGKDVVLGCAGKYTLWIRMDTFATCKGRCTYRCYTSEEAVQGSQPRDMCGVGLLFALVCRLWFLCFGCEI